MFCQAHECLTLTPEQAAELDWSSLPDVFRELRRIMGALPAAKLIMRHGGKDRYYVPTLDKLTAGHRLVLLVGAEAAKKLASECGGVALAIPSDRALMNRLVFEYVMERRAMGWSFARIQSTMVISYRPSERRIRQIASAAASSGRPAA